MAALRPTLIPAGVALPSRATLAILAALLAALIADEAVHFTEARNPRPPPARASGREQGAALSGR